MTPPNRFEFTVQLFTGLAYSVALACPKWRSHPQFPSVRPGFRVVPTRRLRRLKLMRRSVHQGACADDLKRTRIDRGCKRRHLADHVVGPAVIVLDAIAATT